MLTNGLSFEELSTLNDKDLEDLFVKPEDKPVSQKLQTLFELFPVFDCHEKEKIARNKKK